MDTDVANFELSTQPYKGTRDFYPREMTLRNWFFGKIRDRLKLCCFEEYGGPMLESLDIYIAKSGEELAGEQTYNFEDRGGRRLAVRPEMTPTVARMVAGKLGELSFPLRWFSIPNLYRYERPQRGRLREHWQVNVDIFGSDGFEADTEVIATAVSLLDALGASSDMYKVHINNRRFFNDVICGICATDAEGAKRISKVIDRKGKVGREAYERDMQALGVTPEMIARLDSVYSMTVTEAAAICPDSQGAAELLGLFSMLDRLGLSDSCVFDFGIIRGLDYYTGTVFEVFDTSPENNRAMFGGGRYDNLVGLFVKNAHVSGVGFGFGDVTLENFLVTHGLIPDDLYTGTAKVLVTRFEGMDYEDYAAVAAAVRASGVACTVYNGAQRKLGKELDYADKAGYTHAVIMGSDEKTAGVVKIKNLAKREEKTVPLSTLSDASIFE